MDEEDNLLQKLGIVFLALIFLSGLFEIGLLIFSYVNADKVECNLLWCTFTTERGSSQYYITSSSGCYVNGVKINCSDFPTQDYEHFYNDGLFEMNGVCPGVSNMSIDDCIQYSKDKLKTEDNKNGI